MVVNSSGQRDTLARGDIPDSGGHSFFYRRKNHECPPSGEGVSPTAEGVSCARISVIIPALDEEASLPRTIRSCREAGPCEVGVAGGGGPRARPPLPPRALPPCRRIRNRRARGAARPGGDRRRLPPPAGPIPRRGPVRPRVARDHGSDDRGAGMRHTLVHRRPGDLRPGGDVPRRRRIPGDPVDGGRGTVAADAAGGGDGPAPQTGGGVRAARGGGGGGGGPSGPSCSCGACGSATFSG